MFCNLTKPVVFQVRQEQSGQRQCVNQRRIEFDRRVCVLFCADAFIPQKINIEEHIMADHRTVADPLIQFFQYGQRRGCTRYHLSCDTGQHL